MKTNTNELVADVLARLGREAVGVGLAIKTAQLLTQAGPGFRVIVDDPDDAEPEIREDDDCCIPLGWHTVTNHGSKLHREVEAVLLRYAGQSEGEANARLIAAAPEMAELLERIASNSVPMDEMIDDARALLAKIKG